MERMTIPDVMIDEKTTRRTIIDASEVRKHAMEFYWRLKSIEDILGDDYDLGHLRDLLEADRDGRCVVLPCHIGDPVFMGTGRSKITGYEEDICDGFYIGRNGVLQVKVQNNKGNHGTYGVIGQTAELTHEAADAALKGEQDG